MKWWRSNTKCQKADEATEIDKITGGGETTVKGGRPIIPEKRRATMDAVLRLRGTGLSFAAIGRQLGISDHHALNLYNEHWEKEHRAAQESVADIRAGLAARYRLLRDTALEMATNPKIRVTKDDANGGIIEFADFEKVSKMGRLAVMCMVEEAKLFGVNKTVDLQQNSKTLSLAEFLSAAAETEMPRAPARGLSA